MARLLSLSLLQSTLPLRFRPGPLSVSDSRMASPPNTTVAPFRFTELPTEVRFMIYDLAGFRHITVGRLFPDLKRSHPKNRSDVNLLSLTGLSGAFPQLLPDLQRFDRSLGWNLRHSRLILVHL